MASQTQKYRCFTLGTIQGVFTASGDSSNWYKVLIANTGQIRDLQEFHISKITTNSAFLEHNIFSPQPSYPPASPQPYSPPSPTLSVSSSNSLASVATNPDYFVLPPH